VLGLDLAAVALLAVVLLAVFRFHLARTTTATTRRHRTTSFRLFLIALSGGLREGRCCEQQQCKEHYQDSILSGIHFSSPVLRIIYRAPANTPARCLKTSKIVVEQADF
jgi:hypothetical protein